MVFLLVCKIVDLIVKLCITFITTDFMSRFHVTVQIFFTFEFGNAFEAAHIMQILDVLLQAHLSWKHVMTNVTFMLWVIILFVL